MKHGLLKLWPFAFAAGCASIVAMAFCPTNAQAYQRYNSGCNNCHGSFLTATTSQKGRPFPGTNHDMHRFTMGTDCNLCHQPATGYANPFIGVSTGLSGIPGVGCTGCHMGQGLRAHHVNNGITICTTCHGTPAASKESTKPPYYGTAGTKANNPCNTVASANTNENWTTGDFQGLDNDGDNLYDSADPDCLACTDKDADGFAIEGGACGQVDCNDSAANVHPGAAEVCDGIDNNCNGQIDEGVLNACGQCGAVPAEVCDGIDNNCNGQVDEGLLNACGQCGAVPAEVCDGIDNDCDNQIDEGLLNACGQCGAVPAEVCDGIDNDCDGQVDEGVLNACGQCGPAPVEDCNDGIDNDCDGLVDRADPDAVGCPCLDADGDGICPPADCNDSDSGIHPGAAEVCDGIDNNCDGQIDEGVLNACGKCGDVPAEICDGVDNNCDGQIDEGLLNACGKCGDVPAEVCDGQDNNCDGQIDEGLLNACGKCGDVPAEICDGQDNDCDGQIDEDLPLNACGKCGALPAEVCDGIDNNCDGVIDEGLPLNACQTCGPVPVEICDDKIDNDCDGAVDTADPDCSTCANPPIIEKIQTSNGNNKYIVVVIKGSKFGEKINDSVVHVDADTYGAQSSAIKRWSNSMIKMKLPKEKVANRKKGPKYVTKKLWVTVGGCDSKQGSVSVPTIQSGSGDDHDKD